MKKFRLFFKGSPKELHFIDKWKQRGYFLTSIKHFVYTFEASSVVENAVLAVEYTDKKTPTNPEENPTLIHSLQKKLLFEDFHIIYTYYRGNDKNYILNDTPEIEMNYLDELAKRLLMALNLITFIGVLSLISSKRYLASIVPFAWLCYAIFSAKISKRHKIASKQTNSLENDSRTTLTVVMKNQSEKPTIDDLVYLGKWRFVTQRKNEYYYKLTTNFSDEEVKNEVCAFFSINPEDVSIVPGTGLFPLGFYV